MDDRESYLQRIGELVDRSAYRQALKVCDQALVAHPDCAEAHDFQGLILCRMGRYREALPAYDRALSLEPDFVPALLDKAELLIYYLQEDEAGISLADRVLRLSTFEGDAAHAHYLKGIAYANLELHDEAIGCFESSIAIEPDYADAHCEKGVSLYESYRFGEALKVLRNAVGLDLKHGRPRHVLGCVYEHLGEDDLARQAFENAARAEPENYPIPLSLDEEDFQRAVQEALHTQPREVTRALAGMRVGVEHLPERRLLADGLLRPTALAFHREPAADRPEEILLFQRNLERAVRTRAELVEEIAHAVAHELGHPEAPASDAPHGH